MKSLIKNSILCAFLIGLLASSVLAQNEPADYLQQPGTLLDIKDNIGDDKGPGYYRYPADRRLKRGTYDIKSFKVFEEDNIITFVIQMRNYIMRSWPDTRKSEEQGFVANLWDIYVDIDGRINSGYMETLPGRDLKFSDYMGWEKVIMVTPLSEYAVFDILRDKTDELEFQNRISDIIYPDYVIIQRDRMIVKISKKKLPGISVNSGYQCFAMGYSKVVSSNRLLNKDVKAFPTRKDFGGGHDTYGDPSVIDMIVPNGEDQYRLLRNFESEPYRENIVYATVPFVYRGGKRQSPVMRKRSLITPDNDLRVTPVVKSVSTPLLKPNTDFVPLKAPVNNKPAFKPLPRIPSGFVPVKKKK